MVEISIIPNLANILTSEKTKILIPYHFRRTDDAHFVGEICTL